jgi:hypothetical protein
MAKSRDKRGREEKKKKKPKKVQVAAQSGGMIMPTPRREPMLPPTAPGLPTE